MSEDMAGMTEAAEAEAIDDELPTLSARLERLASERPAGGQLREPLERAADEASALEADLRNARRNLEAAQAHAEADTEAHRVERVELERRVVDAEEAAAELHERLDDAETERDAARERLAELEAEVERLRDPAAAAFARRLEAFEAVGRKHAPADGAGELLRMAQWLAEGSEGPVMAVPVELDDVADWLQGRVVEVDLLHPNGTDGAGTTWQRMGLVVQSVRPGGVHSSDLTIRGPVGELDEDGKAKR